MHHQQVRRVGGLGALVAAAALSWTVGSGAASAAGLPSAARDQAIIQQGGSGMSPGWSAPGWSAPGSPPGLSGPVDGSLADVGYLGLPVAVEAGQSFAVRVQAPSGAACAGRIAYPNGQWQSLDEAGTRVGGCAWDVTVPVGTRPGSLVLTADVSRNGQGRNILGVVYVSTWTVGEAGGDPDSRAVLLH